MPRGSAIVNMASINAYIGRPDLLDCTSFTKSVEVAVRELISDFLDTSTKGAIVSFTRGLSNQILADKVIRVNGQYIRH